ncbi:MAG: hypothetical protein WBM78_22000 [Desulfobacterales bacterium]
MPGKIPQKSVIPTEKIANKIYLLLIHGTINGNGQFPIQKCAIVCKFKETKKLRGGALVFAAQAISPIDTEIVNKGHLLTETTLFAVKR